ncbi:hypothetical protein CMO96_04600 [Candidatus Woesebacteria bacterium]|nr:hypothetical protein [Candidatus Woesebacteria bacterium]
MFQNWPFNYFLWPKNGIIRAVMVHIRALSFLATIVFIAIVGLGISFIARGYRFDSKQLGFRPTGLLVVTSIPDGAQILVNGELESATNATISLPPDTYDIELRKEGFLSWQKRLTIKKEEVTKSEVVLFPVAPSLSALTFTGAQKPILSQDGTKIAYRIPPNKNAVGEPKVGLWIIDLGDLPIGFSREPRIVTDASLDDATWSWSPDSRQLLLRSARGAFLVDAGSTTSQNQLINIEGKQLEEVLEKWEEQELKRLDAKIARTPEEVQDILQRKAEAISFSPNGNKVLYTASGSAQIPDNLIKQLPGSSTQRQARGIEAGKAYVYDIKEDRNFFVGDGSRPLVWFPTSNHLVLAQEGKITIMDYDSTNKQDVWTGPYEAPYAIPFPNPTRLLILTSLGAGNGNLSNLYALSLK